MNPSNESIDLSPHSENSSIQKLDVNPTKISEISIQANSRITTFIPENQEIIMTHNTISSPDHMIPCLEPIKSIPEYVDVKSEYLFLIY